MKYVLISKKTIPLTQVVPKKNAKVQQKRLSQRKKQFDQKHQKKYISQCSYKQLWEISDKWALLAFNHKKERNLIFFFKSG